MNQKLKWSNIFPFLLIVLGAFLLVYMIAVEDEPGALPLVLILTGALILLIKKFQNKK